MFLHVRVLARENKDGDLFRLRLSQKVSHDDPNFRELKRNASLELIKNLLRD